MINNLKIGDDSVWIRTRKNFEEKVGREGVYRLIVLENKKW